LTRQLAVVTVENRVHNLFACSLSMNALFY